MNLKNAIHYPVKFDWIWKRLLECLVLTKGKEKYYFSKKYSLAYNQQALFASTFLDRIYKVIQIEVKVVFTILKSSLLENSFVMKTAGVALSEIWTFTISFSEWAYIIINFRKSAYVVEK